MYSKSTKFEYYSQKLIVTRKQKPSTDNTFIFFHILFTCITLLVLLFSHTVMTYTVKCQLLQS